VESLRSAVAKMREKGRVPLGVLSYDPRTDTIHVQLFKDIQDVNEANAILAKYDLTVLPEEDG
jgi:hypothetical protein